MATALHAVNPFRYASPVGIEDLIDRDDETQILLATATEGNHARLVAPRRYGKTSLLRRVMSEAHDLPAPGWTCVYVDFFGVLTLGDVADRIERAYVTALTGRAARWFDGLRSTMTPTVTAGAGPLKASARLEPRHPSLAERLDLPLRVHDKLGTRVLVIFDEFQEVLLADSSADAVIRASIQHHGIAASYVFAGSQVGMMHQLFGDRRRAFYAQARPVYLPPLKPPACGEFIADRFTTTGKDVGAALAPLLALADGHPQRTMLLAHSTWERTTEAGVADEETFARAADRILLDLSDEFRTLWTALPAGQRRMLAAIARDERPYGTTSVGGSRGGAVRSSLTALVDRGEIVQHHRERSTYRVVDPLLAAWILRT